MSLRLTIQKKSWKCFLNDSFQFMAIKVEVSTHENGASQKTVQITETPLERTNIFVISNKNVGD